MSKLYVGDNNLSKEGKKIYIGYNNKAVTLPMGKPKVYGVAWDGGSSPIFTRTDDAANFQDPNPYYADMTGTPSSPFDNISPWKDMVISEDANAGTVVSIPKFYYKLAYASGTTGLVIKIAPASNGADWATENGYLCSPAHSDRGDGKGERDVVYVGRYHCANDNFKSTTGIAPRISVSRANFRTYIHNRGSTIWQWDYAMHWTIAILYLVEFANWNSQNVIGYGCSPNNTRANCGGTDAMQYHTGTSATNRTTYGWTQYRWIEGLWDNVFDWCDGIYFSSKSVYCIKNPANFSDSSNGTLIGTRLSNSGSKYISAWNVPTANGFEYALYPSAVNGSSSTYICDACAYYGYSKVLCVGGSYPQSKESGLFYLNGSYTGTSDGIGSRLMILP